MADEKYTSDEKLGNIEDLYGENVPLHRQAKQIMLRSIDCIEAAEKCDFEEVLSILGHVSYVGLKFNEEAENQQKRSDNRSEKKFLDEAMGKVADSYEALRKDLVIALNKKCGCKLK